jgi:hypothetical protein
VVRRVVGYDRYTSKAALEQLGRVYSYLRLYVNFFQPVMKLKHKSREGAKVRKVYDEARTPYQRLLQSGALALEDSEALQNQYRSLSPVRLLENINRELEKLWAMAEHPVRKEAPVTRLMRQSATLR